MENYQLGTLLIELLERLVEYRPCYQRISESDLVMKYPLLTVSKPISGSEVQKLIHALKTKGDRLKLMTNEPESEYQQLLFNN